MENPLPIYIWGAPGIGKSDVVYQVATSLGFEARTLIASTCDPVDLRGVPKIVGENTVWCPPDFFRVEKDKKVLFFFDELNTATPAVQSAFYRIILQGKLDSIDISHCPRIGAGNRATDMAVVQRMPTPLVSRFQHYYLEANNEDWKEWAYANNIHPSVISFLNFRPELLLKMPRDRDTPFPTPRTYEYLSRMIHVLGDEMGLEDISGCIGEGAAVEFKGFLDIFKDLPQSAKYVLDDNIKFDEPSRQYAVNGILANYFKDNQKRDVVNRMLKYSYGIPAEFAVVLIKDCIGINAQIVSTAQEYIDWSRKFKDVVL